MTIRSEAIPSADRVTSHQEPRLDTHDPSPLATVLFDRNRVTRGDWDAFAPHRARVTELLSGATDVDRPTLCILGAGNGNDIDLGMLARCFAEITLVDLASYDVVASTCLLTQMIDSIATAIGPNHPRFTDFALAVRDGHLNRIVDLIASAGTVLLITDFVSSDTLPELITAPDEQLEAVLARAINHGNFFTGANPAVLRHRLQADPAMDPASVGLHPPWRWRMGHRAYGVCAVAAHKRGSV